ncbi:MAG: LuxR C-terminal-related transcriptional regulator [Dehalogenimonas sp.]|uniref:LuxR C-terminal-related transcriptional regulator n=1 Tax=Candidatus Dehalogenimonas loeffleri TaxID=3127115 RepID=A0ABZ2J964_9CHLR|nr:LuxR C-terminal-related transcriptional regulator [Dehalogenimonas sp.]
MGEADKNPTNFLIYFVAALQMIAPKIGEGVLGALQSPQPPPIESILTILLNEITAIQNDFVLILDDYHVLDAKPIDDTIALMLEHLPPQMHVAIITREDPDLPLARLRARDQLTELRASDLRFTPAEAAEFLNQVMDLNLSAENIAALETRTEGWIAGLQLAAISMRGHQDNANFIKSFTGSHHFILDYLVEEVLRQQPESIQTFLLRTSILERLCGPLCDTIPLDSSTSGQETLEYLERANLFIVPLDNERRWYRYHHLFAELLRQRLEQSSPALVPKLHHRASAWFESENLIEEAVAHAFASHDWEHTADLIQHFAYRVHRQTNLTKLSGWLAGLPESVIRARPWLCVYQSLAFYWTGPRDRIEEFLQLAEQTWPGSPLPVEETTRLIGYIAAIRAHLALVSGNIPRVLAMAEAAIQQLPEGDYMRGWTATALGGAYWGQGNVNASLQAFQTARTVALQPNYPLLAVPPSCYVGMQLVKQGKLDEALCIYYEGLALATMAGGQQLPIAGFPKVKLGDVLREKNDLAGAEQWLHPGIEQCIQLGHPDVLADAYVALSRLQLAQNNWIGAYDTFEKAQEVANKSPVDPFVRCWLDDCRVRLLLAKGRMDDLNRWVDASGLSVDGELSYHYDLHHINLARVLLARARHAPTAAGAHASLRQASSLLTRLLIAAEKAGWVYETIKILVLQAQVFAESNDNKSLQALSDALSLAEPGGFVRIFVDEGPPMAKLLSEAAAHGNMPDYVGKLLAAFEAEKQKTCDKPDLSPCPSVQPLIEPLSQRELEILRLMAQGLSNRQICERVFLALDTVKGHNRKIFDKLQVQRRTGAIARAREFGLL